MSHLTKLINSRPRPFPVDVMAAIKLDYSGKIDSLINSRRHSNYGYGWIAVDEDGSVWVFTDKPEPSVNAWINAHILSRAALVCYLGADVAGQLRLDVYWRDCVCEV